MERTDYSIQCSRKTLQEQSQGFFFQLVDQVSPSIDLDTLSRCTTDLARIRYVVSRIWDSVNAEMVFKGKNKDEAIKKRTEGNAAFEKEDLRRALLCYCQSIIRAPVGQELALVYSNRSALLFKMGEFQLAINDAEMAIAYEYPEKNRHKLYERMTSCYISLSNYGKAKVTLNLAKHLAAKHLVEGTTDLAKFSKKLDKLKESLDSRLGKGTNNTSNSSSPTKKDETNEKVKKSTNKKFPVASEKFGINYVESLGRYAVAQGDIAIGEEILREKPFASCLLPEKMGSHCLHCFARLSKAPIACEICANVAFCSRACRSEAEKYHRYECKVSALLFGAGTSILTYLALRIVTQSSADEFVQGFSTYVCDPSVLHLHLNNGETFDPTSYENVYNLSGLEEFRTAQGFMERAVMAVFLMKCLRIVGYFEGLNIFRNPGPTESELIVGAILLRNLQVLQFNAYEICEFLMESKNTFKNSKSSSLGLGVYNTSSYFNHSCAPNVSRYYDGTSMIIEALEPIRKGDAIVDNYGPIFTKMRRKDRQEKLMGRYWFPCMCTACQEDWPVLMEFPMEIEGHSKAENALLLQLQKLDGLYFDKAVEVMNLGKGAIAIEYLKKYLQLCKHLLDKLDVEMKAKDVVDGREVEGKQGKGKNRVRFQYKSYFLAQTSYRLCMTSKGSVHFLDSN